MIFSLPMYTSRRWVVSWAWQRRGTDAFAVLVIALAIRLVFAALTAGTYDPDEFVVLALSRDWTSGAVPYRDFTFFHPPGILVLFRTLQPLVNWWWPSARLVMVLIDSISAVLVWKISAYLYGRRQAFAAGLLYAASPIALLASVRVGQDTILTALGLAGLLLVLAIRSPAGPMFAGVCLGIAISFKYPSMLFAPIYALAAPRRIPVVVAIMTMTLVLAVLPFAHEFHALFTQSIGWQLFSRPHEPWSQRIGPGIFFWLVLNPLAAIALWRGYSPPWVRVGYALGAVFLLTSQVYYHYFVPIVPFAAILSAPLLVDAVHKTPRRLLLAAVTLLGIWGAAVNIEPFRTGLGMLQLAPMYSAVRVIDRTTTPHQHILTDQFEYAFLARRATVTDYFWDMRGVTSAHSLTCHLPHTAAVISTAVNGSNYPPGFVRYLSGQGFAHRQVGTTTVWLVPTWFSRATGKC